MAIYRKAEKGKYAASRTPTGNLLVGRRHGKTTARVARDEKATTNLFKGTPLAKRFKKAQRRALRSAIKKTK